MRAANHRLLENGTRLHAAATRRPDNTAQVGLVLDSASLRGAMLLARLQQLLHGQSQVPKHSAHSKRASDASFSVTLQKTLLK